MSTPNECTVGGSGGRSLEINEAGGDVLNGYGAEWGTATPSEAIKIISVYTPVNQIIVDCSLAGDGFNAFFFWGDNGINSGSQQIQPASGSCDAGSGLAYGYGINIAPGQMTPARYFGWTAGCSLKPSCSALATSGGELLGVRGIDLEAEENTGPSIAPLGASNLWNERGTWVRGHWPITFSATDPSGVCATKAIVDAQTIAGPGDPSPDQSNWQQCPQQEMDASVDTANYANGPLTLVLAASNAAGVQSAVAQTIPVDNDPVRLTLTGPVDAPTTAGTQYITASASAGPSGVKGIGCSLDDAPYSWYPGGTAQVAVSGLGEHHASCYAINNAIDPGGRPAVSTVQSWSMSIREPSASAISFTRVVDALRCVRRRERVRIPAHWVTAHHNGQTVRIRLPAQTRTIKVVHCHARVIQRRVLVNGHWRIERVVALPHTVSASTQRIAHGATTVVNGWIGTASGNALGAQHVRVMTAPDNGSYRFTEAAAATTAANGSWSARLPAGPSRLVEAVFDGTATVEPAVSSRGRVIVPASVALSIHPRSTHWGGTIQLRGKLTGGYVPRAGELVVLWVGYPGGSSEIGHLYADRDGRFHSAYTFLRGRGTARYRIWAATAAESDYPFAPAHSRRISVVVHP